MDSGRGFIHYSEIRTGIQMEEYRIITPRQARKPNKESFLFVYF